VIRVVCIDDQDLLRSGFAMILEAAGDIEVIGEAADGEEGAELVIRTRPDIVLMDIRMGRVDGIEATRRITAADASRVIILTTFDLDEYVYAALQAGAAGFLLKDTRPAALVDAVRTVAAGNALLAPQVTRRLIERFATDMAPRAPAASEELERLTEREREVVRLLAEGLSNLEIADRLVVSEATVKTHVSHLLQKLGLRDRVQIVVWAYRHGVVRPGD
jgi:DNA-binding NarL/FixJ family response regulator